MAGLKRDGTALPDSVLGMQLIDAANLSENQVQLVLTAVDYEEADKLYEQAKKSLRKFMSNKLLLNGPPIAYKNAYIIICQNFVM